MRGICRRRRLMRWTASRRRKYPPPHPSRLRRATSPLIGESIEVLKKLKIPPQKGAACQTQTAPSICRKYSKATAHKSDSHVSGGAYQDARKVSLVWNAKLKHCFPPEFRGRMHQTRPSALFSPIFSRAREKIGPSETPTIKHKERQPI